MRIVTVVGARPQFVKAAVVSREIREHYGDRVREFLVHTGQHYDASMSEVFFEEMNIPKPDVNLEVGSGTHGRMTAEMLMKIEQILLENRPDAVLVYGDTNSTLAGALAASKLLIPVIHVEAGLRSYNRTMPEEQNRVLTDHVSSLLFCPTEHALHEKNKIYVVSRGLLNMENVTTVSLKVVERNFREKVKDILILKTVMRKYDDFFLISFNVNEIKNYFQDINIDLIIANDYEMLPFAFMVKKNDCKIIFDAHEFAPELHSDSLKWSLLNKSYIFYICRKYIPKVDKMITVSDNISAEYKKVFGIKCEVIKNTPKYYDIKPNDVNQEEIHIVHHGIANKSRRIEEMMKISKYLGKRYYLHFYLVAIGKGEYLNRLRNKYSKNANIIFHELVPMEKIIETINRYDIGLHLLPPVNLNSRFALPNKFFEFIQARLCVAVGPSKEMSEKVKENGIGIVSKNFRARAMAREISRVSSSDIMQCKINCDKLSHLFSQDEDIANLTKVIDQTVEQPQYSKLK